ETLCFDPPVPVVRREWNENGLFQGEKLGRSGIGGDERHDRLSGFREFNQGLGELDDRSVSQ
ncbi:MAG TPA: hypothetical protein PLA90_17195, partial [Candidatus Sumerlaeota bacterium]|nr:hypothetical protein [Candidatus Sumerlaeota bacterium]